MKYRVLLIKSEEGVAAYCPQLPGCCSQGSTEEEALQNIKDAIHEYLEVLMEMEPGTEIREAEVTV